MCVLDDSDGRRGSGRGDTVLISWIMVQLERDICDTIDIASVLSLPLCPRNFFYLGDLVAFPMTASGGSDGESGHDDPISYDFVLRRARWPCPVSYQTPMVTHRRLTLVC